jgi:hypothetical protein
MPRLPLVAGLALLVLSEEEEMEAVAMEWTVRTVAQCQQALVLSWWGQRRSAGFR